MALFSPLLAPPTPRVRSAWMFDGQGLAQIEPPGLGQAVVFAPTEHIALAVLDLPAANGPERLTALAYAFEEDLAQPIETLAFALGESLSPGRHLAAAVDRDTLAAWVDHLQAAGLGHAAIVPDALLLPVPPPGAWSLRMDEGRAVVRTDDGAGFALRATLLESAWTAAGQPVIQADGALDPPLPFIRAHASPEAVGAPPIDLRQGEFAPRRSRALIASLAAIVIAALALHAVVAAIDGVLLERLAQERRGEALAALRQVVPGAPADADLAGELGALVSPANSEFAPLLAHTSAALEAQGEPPRLRTLAFDARDASLTLTVEAGDLGALQRLNSALLQSGLTVTAGAASLQDGRAVGDLVVREPQP